MKKIVFQILETLEERQMHIISPVLARMELWQDRFILTSRPSLETSWLRSVYGRMLSHESGQVVKWSLHHICRLQLEFWPGFGSAQDQWLYGPFLTGLNNVTFYVRDRTDQLPALCEDLVHLLRKVMAFVFFITQDDFHKSTFLYTRDRRSQDCLRNGRDSSSICSRECLPFLGIASDSSTWPTRWHRCHRTLLF